MRRSDSLAPMPLIQIRTSAPSPADPTPLLRDLSRELATRLGKPERYVMTSLQGDLVMTFGAEADPCAYVEIKSIGALDGDRPRRLSAMVSELLARHLALPPERIYIGFEDVAPRLWGWNGGTFG